MKEKTEVAVDEVLGNQVAISHVPNELNDIFHNPLALLGGNFAE